MFGDRATLRDLLKYGTFVRVVGVHDGMGAILATHAGFEALWSRKVINYSICAAIV